MPDAQKKKQQKERIPWMENKMAGKINRITARGVTGIYADKVIEVHIGKSWVDTKIFVDGKELGPQALVQSIHIAIRVGKPTRMTIEKFKEE